MEGLNFANVKKKKKMLIQFNNKDFKKSVYGFPMKKKKKKKKKKETKP